MIIATSTRPGMMPFHTESSRLRPAARSADIRPLGISFAMWVREDNAMLQAGMPGDCHSSNDLSNELFWLE
ncbi:msl8618 [Mesorhizobium japonicum MAFF 303099]|uniref:Msl8618 protein n=1 Tax=Mesorhizobium japonicum (strain LMG 29417 / CECT 9101 / MAFF 303099) TaxID=266835 RepID=Q98IW0_RHILO|nr:msl8618 [Mesorhizobium japonicum MAFF 303099]